MEVIVDELQKNNINIDITTPSLHIHYILDNYRDMYNQMANHLNSTELLNIYRRMNVNTVGRVMAYLTLVYRMNISKEDTVREAVRLVAADLRNIIRAEGVPVLRNNPRPVGSFIRSLCSTIRHALHTCSVS